MVNQTRPSRLNLTPSFRNELQTTVLYMRALSLPQMDALTHTSVARRTPWINHAFACPRNARCRGAKQHLMPDGQSWVTQTRPIILLSQRTAQSVYSPEYWLNERPRPLPNLNQGQEPSRYRTHTLPRANHP